MATIDGRPAQYGVTLEELQELMSCSRNEEGVAKLARLGGVHSICTKLYTSPSEGNYLILNKMLLCVEF